MEYIKSKLSEDLAKKILGSKDNALKYLLCVNKYKKVTGLEFKICSRGKNKGKDMPCVDPQDIWKIVVNSWDYELSKEAIRELFKETEKYKSGKDANNVMDLLVREWESLRLGNIEWPFSQGDFDGFVRE